MSADSIIKTHLLRALEGRAAYLRENEDEAAMCMNAVIRELRVIQDELDHESALPARNLQFCRDCGRTEGIRLIKGLGPKYPPYWICTACEFRKWKAGRISE